MNAVRYYFALLLVVALPPALLFWFIVHPFARYWRRIGPGWTHTIVWPLLVVLMGGLFRARDTLLAVEFGRSAILMIAGLVVLVFAGWLRLKLSAQMTVCIQMGFPELDPEGQPGKLLTEGAYAVVRHPRYVQMLIAIWGWALFCNYLAVYMVFLLAVPALYLIALIEERELRARFGRNYDEYARRVPRFLPRLSSRASSGSHDD